MEASALPIPGLLWPETRPFNLPYAPSVWAFTVSLLDFGTASVVALNRKLPAFFNLLSICARNRREPAAAGTSETSDHSRRVDRAGIGSLSPRRSPVRERNPRRVRPPKQVLAVMFLSRSIHTRSLIPISARRRERAAPAAGAL